MDKELNRKFAEWCRDTGREWIATYGQTEGTARMAYLPPKWAVEKAGSIGIAVPNGRLWLIDSQGNEITEPFTEGEICYAGANVTMGFATCPEDLQKGDERGGWLRTGDLAYFDADGCYYIVGRLGRFLKLYGKRISLDETEQIVCDAFGIECACAGTDEKMMVYLTDANKQEEVLSLLVAKTSLPATAFQLTILADFPRSSSGKILYSSL